MTFPEIHQPYVSEELLDKEYQKWNFIIETKPTPIQPGDKWYHQKKASDSNSEELPSWMLPILMNTDFNDEEIRTQLIAGIWNIRKVAIAVRKRIRKKRKVKSSITEELEFLYGLAILEDLIKKSYFPQIQGVHGANIIQYIAKSDLDNIVIDYQRIGYESLSLLSKTDKKWLTDEYGAPQEHNSVNDLYPGIINSAIVRYCWHEYNKHNKEMAEHVDIQEDIGAWLKNLLRQYIGYALENDERIKRREAKIAKKSREKRDIHESYKVLMGDIIVADLETTGISHKNDNIIEIGAIKLCNGLIESDRFSRLVFIDGELPKEITRLTGITYKKLKKEGVELLKALKEFKKFVGEAPIYFHNAAFDRSFLQTAFKKNDLEYRLKIYDTLKLFREVWPQLPNHKLQSLSKHFSIDSERAHRALSDCDALVELIRLAMKDMKIKKLT